MGCCRHKNITAAPAHRRRSKVEAGVATVLAQNHVSNAPWVVFNSGRPEWLSVSGCCPQSNWRTFLQYLSQAGHPLPRAEAERLVTGRQPPALQIPPMLIERRIGSDESQISVLAAALDEQLGEHGDCIEHR